jgi:hypothetical protein
VALGIGRNNRSQIRSDYFGQALVTVDTVGILSCNEIRFFWMRWSDYRYGEERVRVIERGRWGGVRVVGGNGE